MGTHSPDLMERLRDLAELGHAASPGFIRDVAEEAAKALGGTGTRSMTTEPRASLVEVEQVDRERAAAVGSLVERFVAVENAQIRLAQLDSDPLVQAFARHRLEALRTQGDGEWVLVPREPTEAMWGGLARQIVFWLDMEPKTPRALFKHLKASGFDVPQWLRDEPEMQTLDHVPSKGTRAVLIYRAMIAAPTQASSREEGANG